MRRSVSRKTGQTNSTDATDLFRSASSKASSKEMERIDNLFYSYANKSSGMIDPEGIESLCSDIEVSHTDVRILMLAWKMKAEKQGYFTLVRKNELDFCNLVCYFFFLFLLIKLVLLYDLHPCFIQYYKQIIPCDCFRMKNQCPCLASS